MTDCLQRELTALRCSLKWPDPKVCPWPRPGNGRVAWEQLESTQSRAVAIHLCEHRGHLGISLSISPTRNTYLLRGLVFPCMCFYVETKTFYCRLSSGAEDYMLSRLSTMELQAQVLKKYLYKNHSNIDLKSIKNSI